MAARDESGFTLIELLLAMLVTGIGVMALVAGFTSGTAALQRSSSGSTAAALADQKIERYRAVYDDIPACSPDTRPATDVCTHTESVSGPDGITYDLQLTYGFTCPIGGDAAVEATSTVADPQCTTATRPTQFVRLAVVKQGTTKVLFRQTTTFHSTTG